MAGDPAVNEFARQPSSLRKIDSNEVFTHLRLNIYPDGGVARLRVYGRPSVDWDRIDPQQQVDLAAVENGGRALACSDEHYGTKSNILILVVVRIWVMAGKPLVVVHRVMTGLLLR